MAMNPRLLVPRASGFNPKSIAGLEAWWDAADSQSITLDGGRVATWADKSGKGRNATNSTSGSTQPDYVLGAHNGRNAVRFAAANTQRLIVPSSTALFNFLHNGTLAYATIVARVGDTASPNIGYGIMGNNNLGGATVGFGLGVDDRSAFGFIRRLRINVKTPTESSVNLTTNNTVTFNTLFVLDMLIDPSNATAAERLAYRFDGGSQVKNNAQTGGTTTSNASNDFSLGREGPFGIGHLQGDICEVLLYSQHPTANAQVALRRYLGRKWGVALA